MALTKTTEVPKIEVVNNRHVLEPFFSRKKSDGAWEHTATDISGETSTVQAIATAAWTDDVKTAYKAYRESQEN